MRRKPHKIGLEGETMIGNQMPCNRVIFPHTMRKATRKRFRSHFEKQKRKLQRLEQRQKHTRKLLERQEQLNRFLVQDRNDARKLSIGSKRTVRANRFSCSILVPFSKCKVLQKSRQRFFLDSNKVELACGLEKMLQEKPSSNYFRTYSA